MHRNAIIRATPDHASYPLMPAMLGKLPELRASKLPRTPHRRSGSAARASPQKAIVLDWFQEHLAPCRRHSVYPVE